MNYTKQFIAGLSTTILFLIAAGIMTLTFYPACETQNYFLSFIPAIVAIPVLGIACDLANKIEEKLVGTKPETGYLFLKG